MPEVNEYGKKVQDFTPGLHKPKKNLASKQNNDEDQLISYKSVLKNAKQRVKNVIYRVGNITVHCIWCYCDLNILNGNDMTYVSEQISYLGFHESKIPRRRSGWYWSQIWWKEKESRIKYRLNIVGTSRKLEFVSPGRCILKLGEGSLSFVTLLNSSSYRQLVKEN